VTNFASKRFAPGNFQDFVAQIKQSSKLQANRVFVFAGVYQQDIFLLSITSMHRNFKKKTLKSEQYVSTVNMYNAVSHSQYRSWHMEYCDAPRLKVFMNVALE
jgi:hypothetical protein